MYYFGRHCLNVKHNKSGKTIFVSINYLLSTAEKREETNKQNNCLEFKFLLVLFFGGLQLFDFAIDFHNMWWNLLEKFQKETIFKFFTYAISQNE